MLAQARLVELLEWNLARDGRRPTLPQDRDFSGQCRGGWGGSRRRSGASYLRDRLELRQSARRVASELDPLTALALSSRRALVPRPDLPVLDVYLVDRGRVDEFVALVQQLGDLLDEVDLVCSGPWPPYSFAEQALV